MPTCKVCGRELTSPASILNEIGATCYRKLRIQRAKDYFIANQLSLFECVVNDMNQAKIEQPAHNEQLRDVRNDLDYNKQMADNMACKDGRPWAVFENFRGEYVVSLSTTKTAAKLVYETA